MNILNEHKAKALIEPLTAALVREFWLQTDSRAGKPDWQIAMNIRAVALKVYDIFLQCATGLPDNGATAYQVRSGYGAGAFVAASATKLNPKKVLTF